jgi:hypothetical protein
VLGAIPGVHVTKRLVDEGAPHLAHRSMFASMPVSIPPGKAGRRHGPGM